ncbi:hypothetical protein Golob_018338 [Gossypium lobatum]|uniref:Reverse transcriptase zinc-binding domain-containing protein n=1 Tax=Gossypium lobatum TaxID=34289 RepID=A0A7J8M9Z3_9ROSI|nr:hypothetical protein [Gossypium lobatum]
MDKENLLSEMVTKDGLWNIDLFCLWLSEDVIRCIMGIPPPQLEASLDRIIWRTKRGIGIDGSCVICGNEYEDILHAIRGCPNAKDTWQRIIPAVKHNSFFSGNLHDWMIANLQDHLSLQLDGVEWQRFFDVELWGILEGLVITIDKGFERVFIFLNSLEAV